MWMVRAGQGGVLGEEFESKGCVAIGWDKLTDLSKLTNKEQLIKLMHEAWSDSKKSKVMNQASQVWRFVKALRDGDWVLTYLTDSRQYLVGVLKGDYQYDPNQIEPLGSYPHVRTVDWKGKVSRDQVSKKTRNSLGAIQTLFQIPKLKVPEIIDLLIGKELTTPDEEDLEEEDKEILEQQLLDATEAIKDRIDRLEWDDMQELVAGILRAMGYKTRVSPPGADRGRDIFASPDGLGLEEPRIVVEVKHRDGKMSAPQIRSFLGGLRTGDRGLYVSTGGFSKDAKMEADRSPIPLTLLVLDDLVKLLVEHYDKADSVTRSMIPLVKMYWPAP